MAQMRWLHRLGSCCAFWAVVFALGCDQDDEKSSGRSPSAASEPSQDGSGAKQQAPKPSIVFLGDSLTAGRGLSKSDSYPALIEDQLDGAKKEYRVINAGRSGDTTAGGLARLDWYLKQRVNPAVLVVFLGSNDAMRGTKLESIEENLRAIIAKARAFRPDIDIHLVELRTFPNMGADYGDEFQALFGRVAESENVSLIEFPLRDVAGHPELNQSDGIHPNEKGTRIVAKHIWKSLQQSL